MLLVFVVCDAFSHLAPFCASLPARLDVFSAHIQSNLLTATDGRTRTAPRVMPPTRAASAILALPLSLDRGWLHLPVLLAEDDGDSRCKSNQSKAPPGP